MHAYVVEDRRPGESLGRSKRLTKGYRGRIFGYGVLIALIGGAVSAVGSLVSNWAFGLSFSVSSAAASLAFLGTTILSSLIQALILPFGYIVYVLLYFTARIEKEGFDLEHLANTFLTSDAESSQAEDGGAPLSGDTPSL
jgi:hypothetical protein